MTFVRYLVTVMKKAPKTQCDFEDAVIDKRVAPHRPKHMARAWDEQHWRKGQREGILGVLTTRDGERVRENAS